MKDKHTTIITILSIILFCSSGYGYDHCPYFRENQHRYSSTACDTNRYDCNIFDNKILDYKQKLEPFFEKVKSNEALSAGEAKDVTEIVNEYYIYLINRGIAYGELARDVVNDHGAFARLANSHLKYRAEVEGKSNQIKNIENNLRVALAYSDVKLRSQCKEFLPYEAIAKYHYDVFEHQGLSKYAWGGTLLEEFAGSGSWMNIGGYDKEVEFTPMNLVKSLISNKQVNDVKAREALKSLKHLSLEHLRDSLLASIYRTLITYEPIYEELKKHHNSFFAPDGHMYNFEEYKTEVLDKIFAQYKNQKQTDTSPHEDKESSDEYDHAENDEEDFSNPELNIKFVKAVNLGSTRVIKQIVKRLKNGNIVVMWCTHQDPNYSNMKTGLQIHNGAGNILKGPLNIPFASVDINLEPLSNGGFIIHSTDVFRIYNSNADFTIDGRFTSCFINYRCYRTHVTAMKDNQFLLTWHESKETRSVAFKGQYYNTKGNATSKEFIIYRGTEGGLCKLSSIDDDVGIICRDRNSSDNILNDESIDYLTCVDYEPQSVNCYTTMSFTNLNHQEKKNWKKLPASYSFEPPKILNLGHQNFVILIGQLIAQETQEINAVVINNNVIINTIKIENHLEKKYEMLLTKLTDDAFLITWRDYSGHLVEGFKYNVNGEIIDKQVSIVTKGSNHHFETDSHEFGFVISWLNSKHINHEIQKWHHFEHGYSGAWSNYEEINTTIYMLVKSNYLSVGFIEYIKNVWYSLY